MSDEDQPIDEALEVRSERGRILAIKAEAQVIINTLAPPWKQSNCIATVTEMLMQIALGTPLSDEQQSQVTAIRALWGKIKQIRAYSDLLESDPSIDPDWPI